MCTTEIYTYVCIANARMTIHELTKCGHYEPSQSCTTAMTIVYPEKDISEDAVISRVREKFSIQRVFITIELGIRASRSESRFGSCNGTSWRA
ncbi:hypothetical protein RAB80_014666 [Fusarium oxysporum f. sp. vasinfectum]|nr:hypothetical protein RAB80_014666 [Fusarium oxysporum f. sp. vasinfectum]